MRPLLLLFLLLGVSGCGSPDPAVVHGDVFLVRDLGQYVNLAGLRVHLLEEDAQLDSALARFCPTRAVPDPVATPAEAWRLRNQLLASMTAETTTTDDGARYEIAAPRGRYVVWADTTLGPQRWTWLQRVRVRAGDTVRVNLTNDNADENPFRC